MTLTEVLKQDDKEFKIARRVWKCPGSWEIIDKKIIGVNISHIVNLIADDWYLLERTTISKCEEFISGDGRYIKLGGHIVNVCHLKTMKDDEFVLKVK